MRRVFVFFGLFLGGATLIFAVHARADVATSTNFRVEQGVISTGGTRSTSTNFLGGSSIGQPATGISTSTSFIVKGGFLYLSTGTIALPPTPTTTPTSTPPSTPPGSGGGGGLLTWPIDVIRDIFFPPEEPIDQGLRCDFNTDGVCNLIDLSIMLYHYGQSGDRVARYDLNRDAIVDFFDISILMYYWTP